MDYQITFSNLTLAFVWIGTCLAVFGTLAGYLSRLWWRFDLFTHFTAQYFYVLTGCSILFFILGSLPGALVSGLFALLNLSRLLPFYFGGISPYGNTPVSQPEGEIQSHPYRIYNVLLANVLQLNNQHTKLLDLIRKENPDLIALVEVNQTWIDALEPALKGYCSSHQALREDNYGLALYCRFPIHQVETRYFCEEDVPTIVAHLELENSPFIVIGTHPPPPKSLKESINRNQQLVAIGRYVSGQSGNKIVLGDLNITPWSPYFRETLVISGLRNSQRGMGLQPSWPRKNPLLRVPIDHILVSGGIKVLNRKLGPDIGSDHFPVILEFQVMKSDPASIP